MSESRTWGISKDFAEWWYGLVTGGAKEARTLVDSRIRSVWLAERVRRMLGLLGDFASPADVDVSTESHGEEAFGTDLRKDTPDSLMQFLQTTSDVMYVDIPLALRCIVSTSGEEHDVPYGAHLGLHVSFDEHGQLDSREHPCWLVFALHLDIFSPGTRRNNQELASLNSPRLSAFLRGLEDNLPAEFSRTSGAGNLELQHRYGFAMKPRLTPPVGDA